jgi:hypothetical protein
MAPRLKVFCTSTGLTTSAVAVSSKAKALEAFGTKQDLFKQGLASETSDPELVQAALAKPGEVVSRSALETQALEAALAAMPKGKKGKKTAAAPEPRRGPPPALLARVKRLEERLAELEQRREAEKADFAERRRALEEHEAEAKAAYKRRRKEVEAELATARAAVRSEGG